MVSWVPGRALRSHVARLHGYRQEGGEPGLHRGVPSPWLTVVVAFEEPVRMVEAGGVRELGMVLGGLHTAPVLLAHEGVQAGIQIALSPLGARALLGAPAVELTGAVVAGEDLLAGAAELRERLVAARDWHERFGLVEGFLTRRLRHERRVDVEVARSWQRLHRTGGAARIEELAREVGWSTRYLRRRFQQQVGLPPKTVGRVIRFDRARLELLGRLGAGRALSLAHVAQDFGYADQAHLTRDFRDLSGLSPLRYLENEFGGRFRFVQDAKEAGRRG